MTRRRRILVRSGVLLFSLLVITSQTQAKVQLNLDSRQHNASKGVVFLNQEEFLRMAKSSGLKVHMVKFIKLSKHELEKLAEASGPGKTYAANKLIPGREMNQAFSLVGLRDLEGGLAQARKIEPRAVQLVARLETIQDFIKRPLAKPKTTAKPGNG